MKLLLGYIRACKRIFAFFIIISITFLVTFSLFNLPVEAVAYGFAVSIFFGIMIFGTGFIDFYRRHKQLAALKNEITFSLNKLPQNRNIIESDYTELLSVVFDDKLKIINETERRYCELVDYYTIWVHQIKTPIAAMRLNLQSETSPQNRELEDELQRIEQYVEMVLCYLRINSGTNDFVLKKYDLDAILRQAVKKFSMQFIRKKIRLIYEPLDCSVLTDEKWLLFVIEQVLSNALKYTKSGSISITLSAPERLCISDTGIGIATEDLPRIFEKGYTGCNGRSDKKASGIGLYLCSMICGKLGHRITAVSEIGKGTAVEIDLRASNVVHE